MSKELKFAEELIDFIYESPTAFHAVENVKKELLKNGFEDIEGSRKVEPRKRGKIFCN
jgi:aspartyl aminopeptidase